MTAFVLKIIALIAMLIDHMGVVFPQYIPFVSRIIGRVSFPLFVFLIAEGCRHTRRMPRYLARLGVFALISEIPYDWAFNQPVFAAWSFDFLRDTNVFYTLFLGALCVYVFQTLRDAPQPGGTALSIPTLIALMLLADWLETDYGAFGVAFIFALYVIDHKPLRLIVMALFCCFEFNTLLLGAAGYLLKRPVLGVAASAGLQGLILPLACLAAVPLAAFYNGRRGLTLKWVFYWAYPVHLLVLGFLARV